MAIPKRFPGGDYKSFWKRVIAGVCGFPVNKKTYNFLNISKKLKVNPFCLHIDYFPDTLLFRVDDDKGRERFIVLLNKNEISYEIVGEHKFFRFIKTKMADKWNLTLEKAQSKTQKLVTVDQTVTN